MVHSAMQQDLSMAPEARAAIVARVQSIQTRGDAAQYMAELRQKVQSVRVTTAGGG
jgi:hypothetical protein